jgi:hypothetical protein
MALIHRSGQCLLPDFRICLNAAVINTNSNSTIRETLPFYLIRNISSWHSNLSTSCRRLLLWNAPDLLRAQGLAT